MNNANDHDFRRALAAALKDAIDKRKEQAADVPAKAAIPEIPRDISCCGPKPRVTKRDPAKMRRRALDLGHRLMFLQLQDLTRLRNARVRTRRKPKR